MSEVNYTMTGAERDYVEKMMYNETIKHVIIDFNNLDE